MSDSIKLCSVTLECPDAVALACRVYADPAGHPFCLSTEDVPGQD